MYNEDLISKLTPILASIRSALDFTTTTESTNASISNDDRATNVATIKAAISSAQTDLAALDTTTYVGVNAPSPVESEIIFPSSTPPEVRVGGTSLVEAHAISYDHNNIEVGRGASSFLDWASSDTAVASVSVDGNRFGAITGVTEGNITITVTHRNSGALATLPIVVGPAPEV